MATAHKARVNKNTDILLSQQSASIRTPFRSFCKIFHFLYRYWLDCIMKVVRWCIIICILQILSERRWLTTEQTKHKKKIASTVSSLLSQMHLINLLYILPLSFHDFLNITVFFNSTPPPFILIYRESSIIKNNLSMELSGKE